MAVTIDVSMKIWKGNLIVLLELGQAIARMEYMVCANYMVVAIDATTMGASRPRAMHP
jgi:hypothetical protein